MSSNWHVIALRFRAPPLVTHRACLSLDQTLGGKFDHSYPRSELWQAIDEVVGEPHFENITDGVFCGGNVPGLRVQSGALC